MLPGLSYSIEQEGQYFAHEKIGSRIHRRVLLPRHDHYPAVGERGVDLFGAFSLISGAVSAEHEQSGRPYRLEPLRVEGRKGFKAADLAQDCVGRGYAPLPGR